MALYTAYTGNEPRIRPRGKLKKGRVPGCDPSTFNPITRQHIGLTADELVINQRLKQAEEREDRLLKARIARKEQQRRMQPPTSDLLTMGADFRPLFSSPGTGSVNDPHRLVRKMEQERLNPVTMNFADPSVERRKREEAEIKKRKKWTQLAARDRNDSINIISLKKTDGSDITPRPSPTPKKVRRQAASIGMERVFTAPLSGEVDMDPTIEEVPHRMRGRSPSAFGSRLSPTKGLLDYTEAHQVPPSQRLADLSTGTLKRGKKQRTQSGAGYNIIAHETPNRGTFARHDLGGSSMGAWSGGSDTAARDRQRPATVASTRSQRSQSSVHYNILSGKTPR